MAIANPTMRINLPYRAISFVLPPALFRVFALESYVPGHPHVSTALLVYAWLIVASNVLSFFYLYVCIGMFEDLDRVWSCVEDVMVVGIFAVHLSCALHAMASRRRLASILERLHSIDVRLHMESECAQTASAKDLRRPIINRSSSHIVAVVFIAAVVSTASFYYYAAQLELVGIMLVWFSVIIRLRCLQMMFYVRSLQARLLQFNVVLQQRGGDDSRTLGRIFDSIWDAAEAINRCFGPSTLPLTADVFLSFGALSFILTLYQKYATLLGLLPLIVCFALVCWSCDECEDTVRLCVYRRRCAGILIE